MNSQDKPQVLLDLGLSDAERILGEWARYEDLLYERNEVMNLTRVPREEAFARHFVDCVLFHQLIPQGSEVLDVGTGPGFPAVPLAIARPDLKFTALDSSGKMLGFLREAVQALSLSIQVVQERVEDWKVREAFDVVTGRAVAPLAVQVEIGAAALRVGGALVPMRTLADEAEVEKVLCGKLGLELEAIERRELVVGEDRQTRLFPVFRKVKKTPIEYPRRWADIKRRPLSR